MMDEKDRKGLQYQNTVQYCMGTVEQEMSWTQQK